jgi:hypothetical protein
MQGIICFLQLLNNMTIPWSNISTFSFETSKNKKQRTEHSLFFGKVACIHAANVPFRKFKRAI